MKILLLTNHYYFSKKKAGFHFIADSLEEAGHEIIFCTTTVSFWSLLRLDRRFKEDLFFSNIFKSLKVKNKRIISFLNISFADPTKGVGLFIYNILFKKSIYITKKLKNQILESDLIFFESTCAVLLVSQIKKINKQAKLIYRMSDDFELIGYPKQIVTEHHNKLNIFDKISLPSHFMLRKYNNLFPSLKFSYERHGYSKLITKKIVKSPYIKKINAVFVGVSELDYQFLEIASRNFPEIDFHIFGPFERKLIRKNIIFHGYTKFIDTIPYIQYANIGLACLKGPFVKSLTDSLKMIQYSKCNLFIIAPNQIKIVFNPNTFYYEVDNELSICNALNQILRSKFIELDTYLGDWKEMSLEYINHE